MSPRAAARNGGVQRFCRPDRGPESGTDWLSPDNSGRLATKPFASCLHRWRHAGSLLPGAAGRRGARAEAGPDLSGAMVLPAAAPAGRNGFPLHRRIEPDGRRPSLPQRMIAAFPLGSLVRVRRVPARACQLTYWLRAVNPPTSGCAAMTRRLREIQDSMSLDRAQTMAFCRLCMNTICKATRSIASLSMTTSGKRDQSIYT